MKVYQVNIGNYDNVHKHNYDGEFYYVTEGKTVLDSRRAKCEPPFKISGDVVLYIDGSFRIIDNRLPEWAEAQLQDNDIVFNAHYARSDCYKEGLYCIERGVGDSDILRQQLEDYKILGVPSDNNMAVGGVFLFRDIPRVREFLIDWLYEYEQYPSRDQLALHKVRWEWQDRIRQGWMNPYTVHYRSDNPGFEYVLEFKGHRK